MIPKIPRKRDDGKSSFRTLVKYIAGEDHPQKAGKKGEKDDRAVYVGRRNINSEENWLAAREMEALAGANTRCRDPVFHYILSFRPDEIPTNAQVDEAVEISLKSLGLENCKALYALQNDTGIHHIHVCVCRIDSETGRAIDPAGGWTKKALAKAARQIEVTQGWDVLEQDPFWQVKNGKVIKKSKSKSASREPKLDTKAQDLEAHMGEKSAQRIAIERGSEIIRNARSWEELHEKLATVGLRFKRKGSGAVIVVDEAEIVKASVIGRDCSLSKLEKRIGEFIPAKQDVNVLCQSEAERVTLSDGKEDDAAAERSLRVKGGKLPFINRSEPTEQTRSNGKILSSWQRYQIYKVQFQEMKQAKNALYTKHKSERKELKAKHKRERESLFKSRSSWKGQGKELNLQRSLLAGSQLRERLLLRKTQEAESLELFPVREKFLSYRKWLAANEPERISEIRNWKKQTKIHHIKEVNHMDNAEVILIDETQNLSDIPLLTFSEPEGFIPQYTESIEQREPQVFDFSEYQQTVNEDKTVSYSLRGNSVAFTDKGKEIQLHRLDESAILASLQLANQKWGGAKIRNGSKEHLELCEKLAKQHNLKIQLPDTCREYAKSIAGLRANLPKENIKDAIPLNEYSGTVIGYEKGFLMLQNSINEIVLFKGDELQDIPKVGETVNIGGRKPDVKRPVKNLNQNQSRGEIAR